MPWLSADAPLLVLVDDTLARLRRTRDALSAWEEHEAAELMPEDVRPAVSPPAVSRAALKDLQWELVGFLIKLEATWDLRNEGPAEGVCSGRLQSPPCPPRPSRSRTSRRSPRRR